MPFTLEIDQKEKIVTVEVEGPLDNTIRMEILSAIALESQSGDCIGALIDLRRSIFDLSEPIEGAIALAKHMNEVRMNPKTKLALVYEGAKLHRSTFQKITQKVGYQLRYFRDIDEASLWLKTPST